MQNESPTIPKTPIPSRKRNLLLLVVAVFVLSASAVVLFVLQRSVAPDFMQQVTAALRRGDQDAAISSLRSHIESDPNSTEAKLRLATLLQGSRPDEAIEYLKLIPAEDPERDNAVQQIAVLSILHNRTADAEAALLELATRRPDSLGPQLSLAELYFQNSNPTAALPYAERAVRIAPDRAQTFLLISEIHDELLHPEKMIEPLQEAIRLEPDFYEAHVNLAYAFHKTGQPSEAEKQARWCLGIQPQDVAALRILASACRDQGRFDEAELHLSAALKIDPTNLDCRILEADLLLYRRQPQAAYERLKELYDSQQDTVRYLGALARAAASAGDRDEARRLHQRVAELLQQSADGKTTP